MEIEQSASINETTDEEIVEQNEEKKERIRKRNREYKRAWRQRKKDLKKKDSKEEIEEKKEKRRKRHRESQRAYYQRLKGLKENDKNVEELSQEKLDDLQKFPTNNKPWKSDWIETVRKSRSENDLIPSSTSVICSAHFEEKDFCNTSKGYRRMVTYAVPKKLLSGSSTPTILMVKTEALDEPSTSDNFESQLGSSTPDISIVKTETLDEPSTSDNFESQPGSSAPDISIVKTETLDEPSTSHYFEVPLETGHESPSGLSEDLEGALVKQFKQQLQQMTLQLKHKDQIIKENYIKLKAKDVQIEELKTCNKAKDEKIEQLENAVSRLGERNKTMKLILAKMRRKVLGENVTTERSQDVADDDNS